MTEELFLQFFAEKAINQYTAFLPTITTIFEEKPNGEDDNRSKTKVNIILFQFFLFPYKIFY